MWGVPHSPGGIGESCAQPTGNIVRITIIPAGDRPVTGGPRGKRATASTASRRADLHRRPEMHNPQPYYHYKLIYDKILSEGRNL